MTSSKNRTAAIVAVVALLLGGGVLAAMQLAGGWNDGAEPAISPSSTSSGPSSPVPSRSGIDSVGRGPQPPEMGAWVGAWVKPVIPTQAGRLEAVAEFERQIERPLAVGHTFHTWGDAFPTEADIALAKQNKVLMISWAGEDTRVIQSGRYDAEIRARAEAIKAWGVPFLLRFRWEMNRPNLGAVVWSPADYVAAWKHVRQIFTDVGATNAAWVWCPIATNFNQTRGAEFYPGDDQVDWLCTDVYPGPDYGQFKDVAAEFLSFAAKHAKPIIIGEFGAEEGAAGQREQWLANASTFVQAQPQIKALVYFDARRIENGDTRDFSLLGTSGALNAFKAMASLQYFRPDVPSPEG